MKASKLKSGNWRTRAFYYVNGERKCKSFTAETKAESEFLASQFLMEKSSDKLKAKDKTLLTVRECLQEYIEVSELLSPTTLDSYNSILKYAFKHIMDAQIKDIDDLVMQEAINMESRRKTIKGKTIAPKTVANEYNLIATAIKKITKETYDVKLPKRARNIKEYPSASEVIDRIMGTDIELPCMLAMWLSFSMSELRGLRWSAIRNDIIYIEQVMVTTREGHIIKATGKAENRIRKHTIPSYIKTLIDEDRGYQDYVKNGNDDYIVRLKGRSLYKKFIKYTDGLGISFHDLRHINASVMLMLNIPEKYAMERGGWKTPSTMKDVYQHTFSSERLKVDEQIDEYFNELVNL